MKRKTEGVSAAAWFYSQPGFHAPVTPAPIAVVCAWCKALMSDGVLPASHGICERCAGEFRKGNR